MKQVTIKNIGEVKGRPILRGVLSSAPNGIDLETMRKRVRVLDALNKSDGETMFLEDADFDTLKATIKGGTFGMASPELLEVLDAALDAKDAPAIVTKATGADDAEEDKAAA